ncbi:MAG TPA: hypothetical protein VJH34_04330 [archaeon]|nr:hypothetical protein [archaeon]
MTDNYIDIRLKLFDDSVDGRKYHLFLDVMDAKGNNSNIIECFYEAVDDGRGNFYVMAKDRKNKLKVGKDALEDYLAMLFIVNTVYSSYTHALLKDVSKVTVNGKSIENFVNLYKLLERKETEGIDVTNEIDGEMNNYLRNELPKEFQNLFGFKLESKL